MLPSKANRCVILPMMSMCNGHVWQLGTTVRLSAGSPQRLDLWSQWRFGPWTILERCWIFCVCVKVYLFIFLSLSFNFIFIYIYIYVCICISCIYMYICVHIYVYIYTCVCVCIYTEVKFEKMMGIKSMVKGSSGLICILWVYSTVVTYSIPHFCLCV